LLDNRSDFLTDRDFGALSLHFLLSTGVEQITFLALATPDNPGAGDEFCSVEKEGRLIDSVSGST